MSVQDYVDAIIENNIINNGRWFHWESAQEVVDIYGEPRGLLPRLNEIEMKRLQAILDEHNAASDQISKIAGRIPDTAIAYKREDPLEEGRFLYEGERYEAREIEAQDPDLIVWL